MKVWYHLQVVKYKFKKGTIARKELPSCLKIVHHPYHYLGFIHHGNLIKDSYFLSPTYQLMRTLDNASFDYHFEWLIYSKRTIGPSGYFLDYRMIHLTVIDIINLRRAQRRIRRFLTKRRAELPIVLFLADKVFEKFKIPPEVSEIILKQANLVRVTKKINKGRSLYCYRPIQL